MEALNKEEQELLEILLMDNKALDNFLMESRNPCFLQSLNGNNNGHINIFANGHVMDGTIWKDESAFVWPSFYLERIVERLKKEDVPKDIKNEYIDYILSALKNIISGYKKEDKKLDLIVAQVILKIIKNLGIKYLDDYILDFINFYIKDRYVDGIILELLDVLKQLIDEKNHKVEPLILTIIKATSNEDSVNGSYFYYFVEDFLVKKEDLNKLALFCSMDFILRIANNLSDIINNTKDNMLIIEEKIEMSIQRDNSIDVTIRDTNIKFNLPYVKFSVKQDKIRPIVEENLRDYNDSKKQKRIEQILHFYTQIWEDLTYISYASLNNEPSISQEGLLIYFLKEILYVKLKNNGIDNFNETYQKITENNKYFIFKRIFLYCYGKEFEKTRKKLLRMLNEERALLFSYNFEAEIYNIMEENTSKFTSTEIKDIETLIENGPYNEIDWLDDDDIKTSYKSIDYKKYWQQRQYATLISIEPFKSKYQVLRNETGVKEFFNFKDGCKVVTPHYKSKFSDEEAISKIKDRPSYFVKEIEEFDKERHSHSMAMAYLLETPCRKGVADQLQRLAKNFPKEITEAINNFSTTLRPVYIRHILYGLRETPDRQNIFWTNIFKFIEAYIDNIPENDKEITSGDSSEDDIHDIPKGKDSEYTISAFSDIISIKSDSPFFDRDKAISLLRKFINKLLKKYQFEPIIDGKKVPGDYLQMAINTPMGQVLNKLLQLILDKAISDIKDVKDLYSEMLQNNVVEAYVFLGLYFIYFYIAIPDDWTKEKTDGILADSSNSGEIQYWEIFFEGFIKSDQYLDYYDWMYEHYKRAIKVYSKLEDRRFANLIAQFFLEGKDKLDDKSLLKYCYNKSAFEIISGCVGYISFKINKAKNPTAEEIAEKEKTIPKARELWDFLWKEINNDKTRDSMKDFLPDILGLIPALDKLDVDNYERISQILDNVRPKITDTSHIFSDLICLVNKPNNDENRILYMGKIYKEIIETMDYFTIEDSHKETIEILAKHQSDSKIKDILNEIKNIYINKSWNKYMEWFQA